MPLGAASEKTGPLGGHVIVYRYKVRGLTRSYFIMRQLLPILMLLPLCACSSLREQETEANPPALYMEQRAEVIAQGLVREGKAASIEQAREMAKEIVSKELADQRDAVHENENLTDFYHSDRDERVEGGAD